MSKEINLKVGVDDTQLKENVKTFYALRAELRAARGELAGLEQGSEAFTKAAVKAGELNHEVQQIQKNIAAQSGAPIERLSNQFGLLRRSVTELNFKDAGAQLETISATIKNTSFSELTSGLKSFVGAIGEMTSALLTNPFVLLAAAVGGLIYVLTQLPAAFNEGNKSFEDAKKSIQEITDSTAKLRVELIGLIEDNKVLTGQETKGNAEVVKSAAETQQKLVELRQKQNEKLKKIQDDFEKEREDDGFKATKSILDAAGFETDATKKKNEAILQLNKETEEQKQVLLQISQEKIKSAVTKDNQDAEKKAAEEADKKLKKQQEADKKFLELKAKTQKELDDFVATSTKNAQITDQQRIDYELKMLEKEAADKRDAAIKAGNSRKKVEQEYADAIVNIQVYIQNKRKEAADKEKAEAEKHETEMNALRKKNLTEEISALDSQSKELLLKHQRNTSAEARILRAELDAVLNDEKASYEERLAAQAKYDEAAQALRIKDIEQDKTIRDAKIQIAGSVVDGIAALGALTNQNAKEQFEFQKDITLAKIAIDTASAISSAVAEAEEVGSASGPAGPVVAAASFAASLVRILANIASAKKLLSTGYSASVSPSTSGGTAGLSGGSTSSIQPPSAPPPVVNSQLFNPNTVNQPGQNRTAQPQKVYVLENDIKKVMNRVSVIEKQAKI